jgi:hypothetical protein
MEIVIRQLAPLRPDLAFELRPISFDLIPVHESLLLPGFAYIIDASRAYRFRRRRRETAVSTSEAAN